MRLEDARGGAAPKRGKSQTGDFLDLGLLMCVCVCFQIDHMARCPIDLSVSPPVSNQFVLLLLQAYFTDYSAISLHKHSGAVAVSSQADSQVWVGQLKSKVVNSFPPHSFFLLSSRLPGVGRVGRLKSKVANSFPPFLCVFYSSQPDAQDPRCGSDGSNLTLFSCFQFETTQRGAIHGAF